MIDTFGAFKKNLNYLKLIGKSEVQRTFFSEPFENKLLAACAPSPLKLCFWQIGTFSSLTTIHYQNQEINFDSLPPSNSQILFKFCQMYK